MSLRAWVKNCFHELVDPDKAAAVEELTNLLHANLARRKASFVLAEVLSGLEYKQLHLDQAKVDLYRKFLAGAWRDGRMEAAELATLEWVAKSLQMSPSAVQSINIASARTHFAAALAKAVEDGEISPAESAQLSEIAAAAGLSLKEFMRSFFMQEGDTFLRGVFATASAEGRICAADIERLIATAAKLGLSRDQALSAVSAQAGRFLEHVLADAKNDGQLTAEEEKNVTELMRLLLVPPSTYAYVRSQLEELRIVRDAAAGKLPSVQVPLDMAIRSGELVHYHGGAKWQYVKQLRSGPTRYVHDGYLAITDDRLIFVSETKSHAVGHRKVVGFEAYESCILIQVQGKPSDTFFWDLPSAVPAAIYRAAVAIHNQVLRNQDDSVRTRHIPRDVRQRVWRKYGGRCADCNADDYLEFDHVVPVAKGGSNSDANVQLLCRRCNLKKSDMI